VSVFWRSPAKRHNFSYMAHAGGAARLQTDSAKTPKEQKTAARQRRSGADRDNKLPISPLVQKRKFNQWLEQFATYAPADLTLAAGGPEIPKILRCPVVIFTITYRAGVFLASSSIRAFPASTVLTLSHQTSARSFSTLKISSGGIKTPPPSA
jgi:hypothetical protein